MTQKLKEIYKSKITSNLTTKYQYKNPHEVPKLVKIQINISNTVVCILCKIIQS